MNLRNLILIACVACGAMACNNDDEVVVTGIAGNNFFVTWRITSVSLGGAEVTCAAAGATSVIERVTNTDTGAVLTTVFDCNAFQGLSPQLPAGGNFDIMLDLVDAAAVPLSSLTISNQDITISGTVDLGLVVFQVP